MLSQLGLIILGASTTSSDEMSAAPDPEGNYGPIDGLLDEIAIRVRVDSPDRSYRRPEGSASSD